MPLQRWLLFFLLIASFESNAQTYYPLIENNKSWDIAMGPAPVCGIASAHRLIFAGDTLMPNGIIYQKTRTYTITTLSGSTNPFCPPFLVDTQYYNGYHFFREDTASRKVFVYINSQDELIYDFNLVAGDTLQSAYAGYNGYQTVDSTSSILLPDGTIRKLIYLKGYQYYIEGLGSPTSGLGDPMPVQPLFVGSFLLCVKQDFLDLYGGTYCNSSIMSIGETPDENLLQIYPIPAFDKMSISYPGNFRVELVEISGKTHYINDCSNKTEIDCSTFNSGIYIAKIYSDKKAFCRKIVMDKRD